TELTPSSCRYTASTHQKQPPASTALSSPLAGAASLTGSGNCSGETTRSQATRLFAVGQADDVPVGIAEQGDGRGRSDLRDGEHDLAAAVGGLFHRRVEILHDHVERDEGPGAAQRTDAATDALAARVGV